MTKQANVATLPTTFGVAPRPIAPERFATVGYVRPKMDAMAIDIHEIEEGFKSLCDDYKLSRTQRRLIVEALARRIAAFEHDFARISEALA